MPSSGITGLCGSFIPSLLINLLTVLHSGYINLHSHQHCSRIPFTAHLLLHLLFFFLFLMMAILISEIPHCSFDLHFPNNELY